MAVKWAYLDHLSVPEIVDRFDDRVGIELAPSTIRDYLDEKEAHEVEELIKEEHANTRLQIAEREEQKHKRARQDEERATEDVPIKATVPQTAVVEGAPKELQAWEFVEPGDDDWPDWAVERDTIVRFLDRTVTLEPGTHYPIQGLDGSPRYTTTMVGLARDQPDIPARQAARSEQSRHLEAKGKVLGVYENTINLEQEVEHTLDDDSEGALLKRSAIFEIVQRTNEYCIRESV
ncbi:hypothetical protein ACFFQF_00865 [Haladaptatus pallidirubidus]|uniref:hypothetical protein n=1 Tax=Haladaptatus pallidirubidus TaxID=1008152 RepID=UPI0035EA6173